LARKVDTCFSPMLYPAYADPEAIVVVIDIFRATSAIGIAFEFGARSIIPVATVEEARSYMEKGYLAGAERNAVKVEGFHFGNSPYDYMTPDIFGKDIVLTTTNGTQAIEACRNDAYQVVIGSFLNLTALVNHLNDSGRNVLLLCSGWKNKFNLEDALFAGAVTDALSFKGTDFDFGDACLGLKYLYQMAKADPNKFLNYSSHKERLAALNLKKDIRLCLTPDRNTIIPVLRGNALFPL
jgi:2-phosphosulfolactate phosphatase